MTSNAGRKSIFFAAIALAIGTTLLVSFLDEPPAYSDAGREMAKPAHSAARGDEQLAHDTQTSPMGAQPRVGNYDGLPVLDGRRNFEILRLELEGRARAGDAVAFRHLAMTYEYCAQYRVRGGYAQNIEHLAAVASSEQAASQIRAIGSAVETRCKGFLPGEDISLEKIRALWASAYAKSDPVAMIRRIALDAAHSEAVSDQRVADAIVAAARSQDPEALLAVADLVGLLRGGGLSLPSGLPDVAMAPEAWRIVACRRASSALCDASSILLGEQCLMNARCGFRTYEDLVRRGEIPLAGHRELDRAIAAIENFINGKGGVS